MKNGLIIDKEGLDYIKNEMIMYSGKKLENMEYFDEVNRILHLDLNDREVALQQLKMFLTFI